MQLHIKWNNSIVGRLQCSGIWNERKQSSLYQLHVPLHMTHKQEAHGPYHSPEKQFKSINTNEYQNVNYEKKKTIIYLIRIEWIFIWVNLNPLHPRMLVAKFGCNWSSGSGEENYLISSMYFCYFLFISPWKRAGPFIWTNLNPLHQRMLCAKFGWNWPSGSGEDENVKRTMDNRLLIRNGRILVTVNLPISPLSKFIRFHNLKKYVKSMIIIKFILNLMYQFHQ